MAFGTIARAGVAICVGLAEPAWAGPPFLTDDPAPTETGHWEIYAPYVEAEGRGRDFDGETGIELNYGAAPDLQLTVALPAAYAHDEQGWHWGAGDAELSVKYRFYQDGGFSLATFPAMTLPTASNGLGHGKVTGFLPIWFEQDKGSWSVFGGGGYAINPGPGNKDYWSGGVAIARQFGEKLQIGLEVDRQGADSSDNDASTSLGIGAIYQLKGPFRLLASGGPTIEDSGSTGFHMFVALGENF